MVVSLVLPNLAEVLDKQGDLDRQDETLVALQVVLPWLWHTFAEPESLERQGKIAGDTY